MEIKVGDRVEFLSWINRLIGVVDKIEDGFAFVRGNDLFGKIYAKCPIKHLTKLE